MLYPLQHGRDFGPYCKLVQITGQVAMAGCGYISVTKDAKKDIENLCSELKALGNVLLELEQLAKALVRLLYRSFGEGYQALALLPIIVKLPCS